MVDLVTVGLVAATLRAIGQPAERVIVYAWHPLPIFEFGGSGHIDALMICFIALALFARARQKFGIAGFALGAATLVKFIPVILLPAIYKRWDKKLPIAFTITLVVCYLPYVLGAGAGVLGFLPQYAKEEGLQSGARYYLLAPDRLHIRMVRSRPRFAAGYLHVDGVGPSRSDRHLGILSTASSWKQKRRGSRTMDLFCVRPGADIFDPALFVLSLVL